MTKKRVYILYMLNSIISEGKIGGGTYKFVPERVPERV